MALPTYGRLLRDYLKKHKRLVEPTNWMGFEALAEPLWLAYSMGRRRGYTDLGTYVAKPLDHGGTSYHRGPPAWAFDLGRSNGFFWKRPWGVLMAKRYVNFLVKNHKALSIEYVIFRDRIWSRSNGWRHYGPDTSHFWHIHVSGHWPGR
jgi:hypothetical protein